MNKCLYCGKDVKNKFCNVSCQNRLQGPLRLLEIVKINKECLKCKENFVVEIKVGGSNKDVKNFCSIKCANSRVLTEEVKNKISITLKNNNEIKTKIREKTKISLKAGIFKNCIMCNKEYYVCQSKKDASKYCSRSCGTTYRNLYEGMGSKGGLKSASIQSENRRSKNEIYFSELCIKYFKEVKTNEAIFNGWDADVIIEDIKYAILWNGKWYYEKITKKHSVEQVQNRDKIKIKEIISAGYTPYVIKDMGKYKPNFVEEEFEKMINYLFPI